MDIAALAARLRSLAEELPQGGVAAADEQLESAHASLTEAARDSACDPGLTQLSRSREHLGKTKSALTEAADSIDGYLAAIGVGLAAGPVKAPKAKRDKNAQNDTRGAWWIDRVNELCDRKGKPSPHHLSPTRLLQELTLAATENNAGLYYKRLRDTRPSGATRLPALTWPVIRSLAEDHWGGRGDDKKIEALSKKLYGPLKALMPGLQPEDPGTVLRRACNHIDDDAGSDPATHAAIGPAIAARLSLLPRKTRKHD
ncbi:hypothetical protein [Salininema proteolyticum]|uniref:Uncharacterized protein n=1 Tax=Salininema proteolyticum TaxID=1607685 RepID=A0ABV8TZ61_9ACTN